MAINIDLASANISVDAAGAVPKVTVGQRRAVVHLTKGFASPDVNPPASGDAFTIKGDVDVQVDTALEADAVLNGPWLFSFVQVAKVNTISTTWSGRRDSEGEAFLLLAGEPAWPVNKRVSLDALPQLSPFTSAGPHVGFRKRQQPGQKIQVHVTNSMGDHPTQSSGFKAPNSVTKTMNFLSDMERDVDFFSVLVVRDDKGKFQSLAHVHWNLRTEARFKWSGNKASGTIRSASLTFDKPILGEPADAAVRNVLATHTPAHTNEIAAAALQAAVGNHFNKQDSARRSLLIPKDFFK
jgi:hypothetical protein